jgi:hypothetical protein
MLTDPPNVPQGTTQLNLSYSGIALYVQFTNGTSKWVHVEGSGTVNLLALVNVSKTIASTSLPNGTEVQKAQFDISSVVATINGTNYNVAPVSNQITISIKNPEAIGQKVSGTLLDLTPTLVQIEGSDSNGTTTHYYALVPSATAIHKSDVGNASSHVGDESKLDVSDSDKLAHASNNVTIAGGSLSVSGGITTLSLTIKNTGTENATLSGLVLKGEFNSTYTCLASSSPSSTSGTTTTSTTETSTVHGNNTDHKSSVDTTSTTTTSSATHGNSSGHESSQTTTSTTTTATASTVTHGNSSDHGSPQDTQHGNCAKSNGGAGNRNAIPFWINGTSLAPLFAGNAEHRSASSLTVKPGQTVTISFTGTIQMHPQSDQHSDDKGETQQATLTIVPISGTTYTIQLMGEGYQTDMLTVK